MNDASALPGIWQATAAVVSGQELPPNVVAVLRITLTETRFKTQRGLETLFDSTYSVDASQSPMHIQMIGTGGDFDGQPALGIYSLEGEVLRICYKMPGYGRPSDFASPAGSGVFLITLRRA